MDNFYDQAGDWYGYGTEQANQWIDCYSCGESHWSPPCSDTLSRLEALVENFVNPNPTNINHWIVCQTCGGYHEDSPCPVALARLESLMEEFISVSSAQASRQVAINMNVQARLDQISQQLENEAVHEMEEPTDDSNQRVHSHTTTSPIMKMIHQMRVSALTSLRPLSLRSTISMSLPSLLIMRMRNPIPSTLRRSRYRLPQSQ